MFRIIRRRRSRGYLFTAASRCPSVPGQSSFRRGRIFYRNTGGKYLYMYICISSSSTSTRTLYRCPVLIEIPITSFDISTIKTSRRVMFPPFPPPTRRIFVKLGKRSRPDFRTISPFRVPVTDYSLRPPWSTTQRTRRVRFIYD